MVAKLANIYVHKPNLKITTHNPVDMSALSDEELNAEIEKVYADIKVVDIFNMKKS